MVEECRRTISYLEALARQYIRKRLEFPQYFGGQIERRSEGLPDSVSYRFKFLWCFGIIVHQT